MAGLWHLVKLFLPSSNRSPKYLMGYLALYMLHRKWKNNDGFSLFMKESAKLSDSEKTADEISESDGGKYSESEIDKFDSDRASEEKDLSTSSNSKAESDSEFEKKC